MTVLSPRERVTYAIRVAIASVLHASGILGLMRRVVLRHKAVVLMYHRVLTPEQSRQTASQPGLVVEDDTFERHLAVIKRHFAVLSLDQFADHLARRVPFAGPSCLITFDDGWIDNLENALPAMRQHGVPAVIFLPVHFIGGRRLFTREALTHLLVKAVEVSRQTPSRRETFRTLLTPLGLASILETPDATPLGSVQEALRAHRYASGPEFEALVTALCGELEVEETGLSSLDAFIDWPQVSEMAGHGMTFGGHGADHRVLTQVPSEVVEHEVTTSKTVLDQRLAAPVRSFAYPGGGWNPAIARTVQAGGYELAFTIDPGHVSCDDDPFTLRRMTMHDDMTRSTPMFMARLVGLF